MCFWIVIWIGFVMFVVVDFVLIIDGMVFNEIVDQKWLCIGVLGLIFCVFFEGWIEGVVLGRDVFGDWMWQDGYFCCDMIWGECLIDYNC